MRDYVFKTLYCYHNSAFKINRELMKSKLWLTGYSSGMNPSSYNQISSGLMKQHPFLRDDTNKLLGEQTVSSHSQKLRHRRPRSAVWNSRKKTSITTSKINYHETTPLFGLWQGYDSQKVSSVDKMKNLKESSGLFLPGQNETNITAHIGTTVIMDCKIMVPNLEEHAPVRSFEY